MKAAVSIPDEVFKEADRLAQQLKTSRSQLYTRALKEFLLRHPPDQITTEMNRVCDQIDAPVTGFSQRAARRILENTEW
jgi:metal-responsive CopG/Arc/MetJ family transcriptional regulator